MEFKSHLTQLFINNAVKFLFLWKQPFWLMRLQYI
jgi:hypothetical protein